MNFLKKIVALRSRSCYNLTNLNGCSLKARYSYSVVKPALFNCSCDENYVNRNLYFRYSRGISKTSVVSLRLTTSGNENFLAVKLCSPYHMTPSCWSLENRFNYSTSGSSKDGNRDVQSSKVFKDESEVKTMSSGEKIKTSDPISSETTDGEVVEKKLSLFQKFKEMYRDYWYVLLPVHCVTSGFWFAGFYFLAESGVDIVSILEYIGINEMLIEPFRNGNAHVKAGYLAVAFALYKIATPLRYAVTLGGTTVAINYLKKWGYIKPMPKKEQLKAMYLEQKDILLEKKQQLKSNVLQHLKEVESNSSAATKRK